MKAVLRHKLIIVDTYIREDGRFKISNLRFHLHKPEKEENLIIKKQKKRNGKNEIRNQ